MRPTRTTRPAPRRAMTLLELIASLVVVAAVLGVFVVSSDALVNDSADRQTSESMLTLVRAMEIYRKEHGLWPSATAPAHIDTAMARCMAALRSSVKTERLVEELPGIDMTPLGWPTASDGWGRPMLYIAPADTDGVTARWLARLPRPQGDTPFIVSAGPDGGFGDLASGDPDQIRALVDNLYSFELEPVR